MELEEFVEQDIIIFLDDRLDKPHAHNMTPKKIMAPVEKHEFENEFFNALDSHDIIKAKQILSDLKHEFDQCPTNAPEKSHLKFLLLDLYEQFKDYLDAKNTFDSIEHRLDGKPGQARSPAQETKQEKEQEPIPPPELVAKSQEIDSKENYDKDHDKKEDEKIDENQNQNTNSKEDPSKAIDYDSIRNLISKSKSQLDSGNPMDAVLTYKQIKMIALGSKSLPNSIASQIIDLHGAIISRCDHKGDFEDKSEYRQDDNIKSHEDIMRDRTRSQATPQQQDLKTQSDIEICAQLEIEKSKLNIMLRKDDIAGSMRQYKKLKLLVQQIQDKQKKQGFEKKLIQIHSMLQEIIGHTLKDDMPMTKVLP